MGFREFGALGIGFLVVVAVLVAAPATSAETGGSAPPRAGSPSAPVGDRGGRRPPADTMVMSTVRARFVTHTSSTSILEFKVMKVPTGATLRMVCAGETCAFKTKSTSHQGPQPIADLVEWFGNRALRPGTVLELRITRPGLMGRLFRWQMQEGKYPKSTMLCLPPGAAKPVACP